VRIALLVALTVPVATAACDPTASVTANDVIVELEPTPVAITANGLATAQVRVQTVAGGVKDGLSVKLTLTNATWTGVMGASLDKVLGPDGEATATLTASRIAGNATVLAEIAGYERSIDIPLAPAKVSSFTDITAGRLTPGMASSVQVTVQPRADDGGLPTAGTTVEFSASSQPADSVYLTTSKVVLDASAATAATTVVAGTTTTHVDVEVAVTPPGETAPTATRTITFGVLP
jgi:hypothetical protein